jgi:hypothetical protein
MNLEDTVLEGEDWMWLGHGPISRYCKRESADRLSASKALYLMELVQYINYLKVRRLASGMLLYNADII